MRAIAAATRLALVAMAITGCQEPRSLTGAPERPLRILSLDQCADQYILALAPDADLALSTRADDPDAFLRQEARGRLQIRTTLEAAVAFQPDIVVRYWGGDPRLLDGLKVRGVKVVEIADATDLDGVRADVLNVAEGLGRPERGQALIAQMDHTLAAIPRPKSAPGALYLTAGGFTAGQGTLVDSLILEAGYRNLAPDPGYGAVSVERIALDPPKRFVLGFFDQARSDWRGPGRHPVVRRAAAGRTAARLPASVLTCPGWFAADGAALIASGGGA